MHLSLPLSLLNTHINLFFLLHPTTPTGRRPPPGEPGRRGRRPLLLPSSSLSSSFLLLTTIITFTIKLTITTFIILSTPTPPPHGPPPGRRAGQVAPHPAPRTPQQRCDSSSVRTAACVRHHGRRRPPQAGENHPRVAPSPGRTPWLPHMAATVFSDAHDRLFVHFARNSVDARAREVQNWRSVAAISCGFSGQSDRWIGDLFAPSQSRFVEPTSSARNFAVAAPFCAPSVLVHSWIPGIYIFVLVFLLCSRQVYFSRRKTLCYILWYCIEDLALAPEEAPAGNLA
ncbi:putative formin-like protein 18 isoform X2 [Iris pallida]|uniref:Formin-like protein 18 isoform X2 n=1 Tax=Iris pallida TaxID=29817 RepID=A0AAX6FF92_IRIPA|nr:putative formin-like protein 18 isoform X2 [Iris pallida]